MLDLDRKNELQPSETYDETTIVVVININLVSEVLKICRRIHEFSGHKSFTNKKTKKGI